MSSLNWEAMKARTFQLQKVWEIKCGKTCGWMDLLVGAGVSTAALRIVQYGPNPSLRRLNLCGRDAYSKEKSPPRLLHPESQWKRYSNNSVKQTPL